MLKRLFAAAPLTLKFVLQSTLETDVPPSPNLNKPYWTERFHLTSAVLQACDASSGSLALRLSIFDPKLQA